MERTQVRRWPHCERPKGVAVLRSRLQPHAHINSCQPYHTHTLLPAFCIVSSLVSCPWISCTVLSSGFRIDDVAIRHQGFCCIQ